jgi:hypothetical protein
MISLTYMSTATVPYTDEQLTDLLSQSRENNHVAGLTGMLLYAGGHFIQTLEGDPDAVDTTFERIQQDSRHRNIYIALREEVETPVFPDWSMGFESVSDEAASELPGFNDYLDGKPMSEDSRKKLGRAGIFHRVFRDNMR